MKPLPRLFVCILTGSILAYVLYWFRTADQSSFSPICWAFSFPFLVLANLLTKNREAGEFLAFGMHTILFSGLCDLVLDFFSREENISSDENSLVVVAFGSNLGDSREIIFNAMERIQSFSDQPILRSSLWGTTPVDCPPGSPKFLNAVIGLVPQKNETPESLLKKLQDLEKVFGRVPKIVLNEPRPLDLDLIAFGNEIRNAPELILPHPRAHLRRFVLQPLSEIAPELILPGQTKTAAELLAALPEDATMTRG